jgi:hypothetical protein
VAPRPSHRSVRAQLRHTAPQIKHLLCWRCTPVAGERPAVAAAAHPAPAPLSVGVPCTRWWSSKSPSCCPPTMPNPTPPSLRGVPEGRVPPLRRYYEAFRLPADLPAALRYPSVGSTIPCACVRLSLGVRRRPWGLELLSWAARTPMYCRDGAAGSPRFLGNPHTPTPGSLTPAASTCLALTACRHGPPQESR